MIKLGLEGVDALFGAMDKAQHRFDRAAIRAVNRGAMVVQSAAKANIHNITGELRKHIKRKLWKRGKDGFVGVLVGPLFPGATPQQRSYYGRWVEEGYTMELGGSKVPPHPYLRPALDNNRARVQAEMAIEFKKAVDGIEDSDTAAILSELMNGG